ncbi:hypothetical protein D3C87_1598560 [compost metagenome]
MFIMNFLRPIHTDGNSQIVAQQSLHISFIEQAAVCGQTKRNVFPFCRFYRVVHALNNQVHLQQRLAAIKTDIDVLGILRMLDQKIYSFLGSGKIHPFIAVYPIYIRPGIHTIIASEITILGDLKNDFF